MKLKYLIPVALFAVTLIACDENDDITPDRMAQPTVLNMTDQDTYALDDDQEVAFTLSWTPNAPDLKNASYLVEMDSTGHDFSKAVVLGESNAAELSVLSDSLQVILRDKYGLNEMNSTQFDIRVTTMYGINRIPSSISNIITLTLIPHSEIPTHLYAVGSFNGWDVANAPEFTRVSDGVFEIIIDLNPDDEYKYVQVRQWDVMPDFSPSTSTLDVEGTVNKGGNSPKFTGEAGTYKIRVDFNTMKTIITSGKVEMLYIIGNAIGSKEWDNANTEYIMFREDNDAASFVYTYTGKFKQAEFKLISGKDLGTWSNLYGSGGDDKLSQDSGAGNISVPAEGYYTLTVNTRELTYSLVPYDTSSAQSYTAVGLVGEFNGWGNDLALTVTDYDPHIWIVNESSITAGEIKFRADNDWADSWGGSVSVETFGRAVYKSNDNMNLTTSSVFQMIKFNDLTGHYIFIEN